MKNPKQIRRTKMYYQKNLQLLTITVCFSYILIKKMLMPLESYLLKHITFNSNINVTFKYQGRKEMFYLTTHSIHLIYGYMVSDL